MENSVLEELYERQLELHTKIDNYFFPGQEPDINDQGYIDLLNALDDVDERINEIE